MKCLTAPNHNLNQYDRKLTGYICNIICWETQLQIIIGKAAISMLLRSSHYKTEI